MQEIRTARIGTLLTNVYDDFFNAIGVPMWHGRNFNALRDSIATGGINKIEAPYVVKIRNYGAIGSGARSMAADFVELIKELHDQGARWKSKSKIEAGHPPPPPQT